MNINYYK